MQRAQTAAGGRWMDLDPLRGLWRLLTSVRFALVLIAVMALAALLGVLIPQLPAEMRGNPAAEAAWLNLQEEKFGFLSDPMYRLGMFQLFRSPWFIATLGLLVASVCVCTANRLPPIWRNAFHPQTRVPDEYFGRDQPVITATTADPARFAAELRRRRYAVTETSDGETTYLFADRYPWAQLATFVSHLALILFLAGGFVTVVTAREEQVFVAEGAAAGAPVFAPNSQDHMQVYVQQAIGRFLSDGSASDFRTELTVYKNGKQIAQGFTTVNDPLSAGGFRFHQSAFFPDGAALTVREAATGRLVYDEVLALVSSAQTPRVVIRDTSGAVLVDDVIVPTDFVGDVAGTLVTAPGGRSFWVGARPGPVGSGWQLLVYDTAQPSASSSITTLREGEMRDLGGLSLSFPGVTNIPSLVVRNLPGGGAEPVAELSNNGGNPVLTVGPIAGQALALAPGQKVTVGGYEYEFGGVRAFSGLTVRRDPGAWFIWVATGVFLLGLGLTFYTPRRRLWGKITAGEAAFRGLGGRGLAIEKEIREVAARASLPSSEGNPRPA